MRSLPVLVVVVFGLGLAACGGAKPSAKEPDDAMRPREPWNCGRSYTEVVIIPPTAGYFRATAVPESGAITGIVFEHATKTPVPGATIALTSPLLDGMATELSDEVGRYRVTVPPGVYRVTVYVGELSLDVGERTVP